MEVGHVEAIRSAEESRKESAWVPFSWVGLLQVGSRLDSQSVCELLENAYSSNQKKLYHYYFVRP